MSAAPSNRDLLAVVRAWVASNYPGCNLDHVVIHCLHRGKYPVHPIDLAESPEPPINGRESPEQSGDEHEGEEIPLCVQEILQTLREIKKPLSLTLLKEEMDRSGRSYSRSTLAHYCAQLVADGTLENPADAKPRGYRLPE